MSPSSSRSTCIARGASVDVTVVDTCTQDTIDFDLRGPPERFPQIARARSLRRWRRSRASRRTGCAADRQLVVIARCGRTGRGRREEPPSASNPSPSWSLGSLQQHPPLLCAVRGLVETADLTATERCALAVTRPKGPRLGA